MTNFTARAFLYNLSIILAIAAGLGGGIYVVARPLRAEPPARLVSNPAARPAPPEPLTAAAEPTRQEKQRQVADAFFRGPILKFSFELAPGLSLLSAGLTQWSPVP